MTFDVGKKYKTKGGWDALVAEIDDVGDFKVKHEVLAGRIWHSPNGKACGCTIENTYDLIDPDAEQPATTQPAEPDYETRLRDQAALAALQGMYAQIFRGLIDKATGERPTIGAIVKGALGAADAFMAERKERMEGR